MPTDQPSDSTIRRVEAHVLTDLDHPERIGPYRILQVLGEGGMGVVYEAEQSEPVRRRVALKVMKIGMDTKAVVARFQAEQQALAVMEHPNIAKVFDAGVSATGRPFFVMEHVRGIPITVYSDMHKLTTAERLELFVPVCEAVQHAHQKGVIHRDLKPSNVMVAEEGGRRVPKIIDFGIAKATGQRLTDVTLVTEYGQAIGTPAYMSPEQAEMTGLDVDTRTDIYSLGVMLYELLVGRLPLDPDELGMPAFIARLVMRETDPVTPSTRLSRLGNAQHTIAQSRQTDPPGLRRELSGDLDWIVMKAMESDRTRRYQAANELAFEIRRFLNDEPVLARPPSARYRLGKFVRRNRGTVVAAATAVVALLVGSVAATVSALRAVRAERHAAAEAEASRQVSDFLVGLFQVSDPGEARGNTITARELLDEGVEQISTELANQPLIQARLLLTMGDVYRSLGLYEDARPMMQRAVDLRTQVLGPDHLDVAASLQRLATLLTQMGRYSEAEDTYQRVLSIRERALGPDHSGVALTLQGLSNLYSEQGRYAPAESLLQRSIAIQEAQPTPDDTLLADRLSSLGNLYMRQGKYDAADSLLTRVLAIRERALGPDHPDVALSLSNLGGLRWYQQRLDEAERFFLRSLEIRMKVLGPDHPSLADVLNNLGALYWMQERYAEAAPLYDRARELWEASVGSDHVTVAMALNNLAETHWALREYDEAEPLFLRALDIKERILDPNSPSIAVTLNGLANVYRDQGRYRDAERLYQRALSIRESQPDPDERAVSETVRDFASLLRQDGRASEAAALEARLEADSSGR